MWSEIINTNSLIKVRVGVLWLTPRFVINQPTEQVESVAL